MATRHPLAFPVVYYRLDTRAVLLLFLAFTREAANAKHELLIQPQRSWQRRKARITPPLPCLTTPTIIKEEVRLVSRWQGNSGWSRPIQLLTKIALCEGRDYLRSTDDWMDIAKHARPLT